MDHNDVVLAVDHNDVVDHMDTMDRSKNLLKLILIQSPKQSLLDFLSVRMAGGKKVCPNEERYLIENFNQHFFLKCDNLVYQNSLQLEGTK